jgi:hypothetical protein
MRALRPSGLAALIVLTASFWLGAAFVAHAQFTAGATAGPLTISTASSFGPPAPAAGVWLCLPGISVTTVISWSNGGGTGNVEVLRALTPNGPFVPIAFRLPFGGFYFDTMHLFSTSVYYAVSVGGGPLSASARVDLPDVHCR